MPVHMRFNVQSHSILAERPDSPRGSDGSIRILRPRWQTPLVGLFEKTMYFNNISATLEDGRKIHGIKANRNSIINYLEANDKLEDRHFCCGTKGLFGIGLFGTGLSDEEVRRLFNECVEGKERVSRPPLGGDRASNELSPIDPNDMRAPRGVRGTFANFSADFRAHISAFDPRPGVREAHPVFTEEDGAPASIETYIKAGKRSPTDVIVHVRIPGNMPESMVFLNWYTLLENKLGAANIEEIVVYPTSVDDPGSVDAVWAEISKACRAAHTE